MDGTSSSSVAMDAPKPCIGILSIGDMGLGISKLLRAHDYPVSAKITLLENDSELVSQADIILSIVPPRDAIATARRIANACHSSAGITARNARRGTTSAPLNLTFVDLNAISLNSVTLISNLLSSKPAEERRPEPPRRQASLLSVFSSSPPKDPPPEPIPITFIDGAIIGPPPRQKPEHNKEWTLPSLSSSPSLSPDLPQILHVTHVSPQLGGASTLKSCFASLTKGLTALSLLSFTTAQSASLLPHLTAHLEKYSPGTLSLVKNALPAVPAKAHRWVDEMRQVGENFAEVGGLQEGKEVFDGFAGLYALVAEETEVGREAKRGKTVEDALATVEAGVKRRRRKQGGVGEEGEEDLSLTWRGSWT
ncbi:hypothetical protein EPUS_02179 [Endocarpon pusillum Z07020]|uniref:Phosphogluconate dehydrogenase NAD-binding putative C-terminal domain-containing protein n=1 Tax=Endocarpon pusillum (strain Z07020 / HMAS-L-300199) TaxID=1263415 RepID=U1G4P6_ENDPU|nr:uncharacterized protein EPUS_02179 [Endocarpon pusillum Z07020]ERF72292.1 hypothetical protein EPUS_02179 [Endocarpon pusillum Z07020]